MAKIRLTDLNKSFGAVKAVKGMSLDIGDGEFVAFLGPSGCGKTTTLRMISGLELPDSGTIMIGDRDVTTVPPRSRDIAMVFQDYALYPHMSIMDNVGYPLKVRGVPRADRDRRVTEVARNLQIDELVDRRPAQLSGGQQQRAAVARAVVHEAQIFLFDEPLSNLDAKLRLEARAFLKRLQREVGVTSVYVTHDQAEAMALADRIVVMNEGKIMQVGTPLEIYHSPANTFVAGFIGNPPMNLLSAEVRDNQLYILAGGDPIPVILEAQYIPDTAPGEKLSMGIRPEHIEIETQPGSHAIPAELYVIQNLGSEVLVVVRVGDQLLSVKILDDQVPDYPEQIWLAFDPEKLFFYGTDGELLT